MKQDIAIFVDYDNGKTGVPFWLRVIGVPSMCDYSLELVASRPAEVGDKLVSTIFPHTVTRGFVSVDDPNVAVCVLPGTELAFEKEVRCETACSSLGGSDTRWLGSDRSTKVGQTPIMTPLSFLMGRSCC
jgi:hypothetical protein